MLFEEKIAAVVGTVSKTGKVNERVDPLRISLFGKRVNHGGLCGELFYLIGHMLLDLIRDGEAAGPQPTWPLPSAVAASGAKKSEE